MAAPVGLARGGGELALRIREKGAAHKLAMLAAAPLGRAVHRNCEPGAPTPTELYSVVAEVLAWVYRLRSWHKTGGSQPKKPENLSVPPALDFAHESQE